MGASWYIAGERGIQGRILLPRGPSLPVDSGEKMALPHDISIKYILIQ
jgi:hypothetical protein